LGELGIPTEKHHHEVAGAGQHELGMKFDSLLCIAVIKLVTKVAP